MAGFLAKKGLRILRNGYNVIPIKPGEKFPELKGWQNLVTKPADIQRWLRNGHADDGVGITTGKVSFVDLDTPDIDVAMKMENWIHLHIGLAAVRIGNAPKRGLLFRTETPFRKLTSKTYTDKQGRDIRVEILGVGQQFVSHHIHPETKRPYLWSPHDGPEFVPVADLPEIVEKQAWSILEHFEEIASSRTDWTVKGTEQTRRTEASGDDDLHGDNDPVSDLTIAQLRQHVESIPNDDVIYEHPTDLSWTGMLFAVAHQTDKSPEGREIAFDWSCKSSKHTDERFDKTWNSSEKPRPGQRSVTARYILKWSKFFKEKNDARPTILLRAGHLHEIATQAEQALLDYDAPIYVRGEQIVRPIVEDVDASKGRRTKTARLTEVLADGLMDWMSRSARWVRLDMRAKKRVLADPPARIASIVLSRDGEWLLRSLAGVITTPTIRPDGSLLLEPGYDPATRLLLLQPPPMPPIADRPTKEQAWSSLRLLESLLTEFPFVDGPSYSVGLSILITPVVRGALPVAPLHLAKAPSAGSGKSYLIDVASAIVTGRLCPVVAAGKNEEETEKRLGAALLSGQPLISIDNLNGELEGDFICQAVERPRVQVRILGRSEAPTIETRATIFATGNNLTVKGDMVRRTISCELDPNVERPELREFKNNPVDRILADRGRYIAAALTIVRAYIGAGCPSPCRPLASFEDWSRLVRSALVWLGCDDPVDTIETSREADPDIQNMKLLVKAWSEEIGVGITNAKTSSEIIALSEAGDENSLHEVLSIIGFSRNSVGLHPITLGKWLTARKDRVVDGLKLVGDKNSDTKVIQWYLREMRKNENIL